MVNAETTIKDEFNVLDVLGIIAELWFLLVGLPIIAGVAAFALVTASPTKYQATATAKLIADAPALVRSSVFHDQLQKLAPGIVAAGGGAPIVVTNDGSTNSTRVVVTQTDANRAGQIAIGVVEILRRLSPPDIADLEIDMRERSEEVERLQRVVGLLERSLGSPSSIHDGEESASIDAAASAFLVLSDALTEKRTKLLTAQKMIAEIQSRAVRPPLVEVIQLAKDRRPIVASILGAAVLAVMIGYLQYAISLARRSPGYDEKSARIRKAFSVGRGRSRKTDGGQ